MRSPLMDIRVINNNDKNESGYNLSKMQDSVKSFLIRDLLGIGTGGSVSGGDAKSGQNASDNGNEMIHPSTQLTTLLKLPPRITRLPNNRSIDHRNFIITLPLFI